MLSVSLSSPLHLYYIYMNIRRLHMTFSLLGTSYCSSGSYTSFAPRDRSRSILNLTKPWPRLRRLTIRGLPTGHSLSRCYRCGKCESGYNRRTLRARGGEEIDISFSFTELHRLGCTTPSARIFSRRRHGVAGAALPLWIPAGRGRATNARHILCRLRRTLRAPTPRLTRPRQSPPVCP